MQVTAPKGAHFEFEEVRTDRGAKSLGNVPILVWDELDEAVENYGEESVLNVLDGTSLRVSFQGMARRMRAAEKSDDEIGTAQIEFKPGTRQPGQSTPVSRAKASARRAAERLGDDADAITALLDKVASGEIDKEKFAELLSLAQG
jgi:hypothetical protein